MATDVNSPSEIDYNLSTSNSPCLDENLKKLDHVNKTSKDKRLQSANKSETSKTMVEESEKRKRREISVAEKLVKTERIWYLPTLDVDSIVRCLANKPIGVIKNFKHIS